MEPAKEQETKPKRDKMQKKLFYWSLQVENEK